MTTSIAVNKKAHIFLLSAIGVIALPHVFHLPNAVIGYFLLLLGWCFAGIFQPARLPGPVLLILLTVCGLAILYFQFHTFLGRDAGTSLFLIALGLKLMELKSARDIYLVNNLAFIVAASQFLFDQSILMAAYILLVSCVLLAVMIFLNSNAPETLTAIKKAAVIVAQAIPMTIAVFIFFPRVEAPRWLLFNDNHEAMTGLSDSMEPGSITDLGMSDELAFRVRFDGAIPPPAQRYWRGPVLTHTNGKRWTQSKNLDYQQQMAKPSYSGQAYQYKLLMEPQNKNWVYALDLPATYPQPLQRNANYQLISPHELDKRSEYQLTSYPLYNTGTITKIEYRDARQLPGAPSGKIKQLVEQLHGFKSSPEEFINHLLNHFRQEDFHYTLTPPLMEENPIETFLFETRRGFCSHYAAAFVYLLRTADIPARVVTGYQGGELNSAGNYLEIRQADAHAWAEVWLENKGWIRFDPTAAIAPERIERSIDTSLLAQGQPIQFSSPSEGALAAINLLKNVRQLWHSVDYNWQRWVINYNSANQSNFLSSFGIGDFRGMVYWMMAIVAIITALLSLYLFYQSPEPVDPGLKAYKKFLKKLAKAGYPKNPGEGPREFAERIKLNLPHHSDGIEAITSAFLAQHYGKYPSPEGSQELKSLIRTLKILRA
jgi:protein-glutamine gamma-glutamyltransferase